MAAAVKDSSKVLENQICFPLYACSREIVKMYSPYLEPLNLTYTQYISLMVLWEKESVTVKELGTALYLDSGTLTPLLKKLEARGLVTRQRSKKDERNLIVTITDEGKALKAKARGIPAKVAASIKLEDEDAQTLQRILYKLLDHVNED